MAVEELRVRLLPFEPDNEIHVGQYRLSLSLLRCSLTVNFVAELRRQRILCGWGLDDIPGWLQKSTTGDKGLYWVIATPPVHLVPYAETLSLRKGIGPPPPNLEFQPIGHISMDWYDFKGDTSLASRENGIITIASFFLLKSQQGKRFGSACMDQLEEQARKDPRVKVLTLNVLYGKDCTSPEMWHMLGVDFDPNKAVLQEWYERRGYVQYDMKPRYEEKNFHTGEDVFLNSAVSPAFNPLSSWFLNDTE